MKRISICQMENCVCYARCELPNQKNNATAFASMTEMERSNCVRRMLIVLTKPSEDMNDLHAHVCPDRKQARLDAKKRKHEQVTYTMKGQLFFREAFAGIVQMNPRTINRIATEIASSSTIQLLYADSKSNKNVAWPTQTLIAITCLQ